MGIFDRLEQMASRTVDAVNAVGFTLTPMASNPNGRPQPDPDRQVLSAAGILDFVDDEGALELGNRDRGGNDLRTLVSASRPILSVDRRYFPTLGDEPRQGDQVQFPSRPDLPRFEIASCQRDGLSRLSVLLVKS